MIIYKWLVIKPIHEINNNVKLVFLSIHICLSHSTLKNTTRGVSYNGLVAIS